jgi:hypothetical protein
LNDKYCLSIPENRNLYFRGHFLTSSRNNVLI